MSLPWICVLWITTTDSASQTTDRWSLLHLVFPLTVEVILSLQVNLSISYSLNFFVGSKPWAIDSSFMLRFTLSPAMLGHHQVQLEYWLLQDSSFVCTAWAHATWFVNYGHFYWACLCHSLSMDFGFSCSHCFVFFFNWSLVVRHRISLKQKFWTFQFLMFRCGWASQFTLRDWEGILWLKALLNFQPLNSWCGSLNSIINPQSINPCCWIMTAAFLEDILPTVQIVYLRKNQSWST